MFKRVTANHEPHPDAIAMVAFSDSEMSVAVYPEILEAVKRTEWKAEAGQVIEVFPAGTPRVFLLGLGKRQELTAKSARKACAALARQVAKAKIKVLHVDCGHEVNGADVEKLMFGQACGEAFGLLGWTAAQYRASKPDDREELALAAIDGEIDKGIQKGIALADSQNYARTLCNTPPNIATPDYMATKATELASEVGLTCTVYKDAQLDEHRLVGIQTVGRASNNRPCFVRLEYKPAESNTEKPVVLVGKTITYDTGGLSLKISGGMVGMKGDKGGGCAVLGAMHAIATVIKPNFPVVGLLCVAENSVNGDAFRPDDVITYRNGVSVEVTNTDAEGRLVLADGLCWAYEKENPRAVIDLATLTGGIVVAIGSTRAGMFATEDDLADRLFRAGEATNEKIWRMPLDDEYKDLMKSKVADMVNSCAKREAHPVQGAIFLKAFVGESAPWAHLDIAGTSGTDADSGYFTPGATGFGVRLLAKYLEELN